MVFLLLLLIPLLIAGGFFVFTKKMITWQEFLVHMGIAIVVAGISTAIMYFSNTHDVEVWGGKVSKKERQKVSCKHDYCCQYCESCTTDSKGNQSCSQYCCRTCYDHPFDVDWSYWTTDDGHGRIARLDRQGLKEPPRWTQIVVGEPSASSHRFENFIKAAPDTLFTQQGLVEKYKQSLPYYPGKVYDYYKINRLVTVGVGISNPRLWNELLMEANGALGSSKQVNMGIVLVKSKPRDYFNALRQYWLGGKKNDLFLVASVDGSGEIEWADVMAWTTDKVAEVSVRNAALEIGSINEPEKLIEAMASAVEKDFVRKPMKDFEYLSSSITPSTLQWVISMIINILISIAAGVVFFKNDFQEGGSERFRYRRFR